MKIITLLIISTLISIVANGQISIATNGQVCPEGEIKIKEIYHPTCDLVILDSLDDSGSDPLYRALQNVLSKKGYNLRETPSNIWNGYGQTNLEDGALFFNHPYFLSQVEAYTMGAIFSCLLGLELNQQLSDRIETISCIRYQKQSITARTEKCAEQAEKLARNIPYCIRDED